MSSQVDIRLYMSVSVFQGYNDKGTFVFNTVGDTKYRTIVSLRNTSLLLYAHISVVYSLYHHDKAYSMHLCFHSNSN